MNNVLGILHVDEKTQGLHPLTKHRCTASVPFASRYRMIDFMLSSMVNSNIQNIAVFTTLNNRSLLDHLGDGKDWDLDRKQDGLFTFSTNHFKESSNLKALQSAIDYLEKSSQEYVLICLSNLVTNIDFRPLYNQHVKSDADVTVMCTAKEHNDTLFTNIEMDDFQNIMDIDRKQSNMGSLDIYMISKSKLIDLISTHAFKYRYIQDVIRHNMNKNIKVKGFKYEGYVTKINTIKRYYDSSIDLLDPTKFKQLFKDNNEIYTKLKDEPPTTFHNTSSIKNSLIANGCIVEGHVENSILFRGVHVNKGAVIKNSIVMQKCMIGEYAQLDRMILDKEVNVLPNDRFLGTEKKPRVVPKKKTIGTFVI
ncbi:glucose-1-phosphate adenylyltransferase subunit GlgD [Aquibacillus rhizosphaerae]|uniref:Glucose-1-phosphate adenylyltransferase subunit GlgD n=1 Tax=Aquibacillus rhizosphaerae TaxID=3051431 RepID=A0ABT7L1F0_9BACI|nr:glucose-1-phosphate adenylyltransferase subunit GlgD [Aquibacillus sp. LR5S19]MDL4839638.1 glucose-1-phosphate adenylyltransferase subunit GlgD [Aquibacillus sp. LR5S19]